MSEKMDRAKKANRQKPVTLRSVWVDGYLLPLPEPVILRKGDAVNVRVNPDQGIIIVDVAYATKAPVVKVEIEDAARKS